MEKTHPLYEYYHGDNGAGIGASHQTGWSGIIAKTIQFNNSLDAKKIPRGGESELVRPAAHTNFKGQ